MDEYNKCEIVKLMRPHGRTHLMETAGNERNWEEQRQRLTQGRQADGSLNLLPQSGAVLMAAMKSNFGLIPKARTG